jgi:hypothetical protein
MGLEIFYLMILPSSIKHDMQWECCSVILQCLSPPNGAGNILFDDNNLSNTHEQGCRAAKDS